MVSKYAGVVEGLPKQQPEQTERRIAVESVKTELASAALVEVLEVYETLRKQKDELKDDLSALEVRIDAHEEVIIDLYEAEGLQSVTLEGGAKVDCRTEPGAQVEDPELFRQWCVENGLERSLRLPPASANSLVKERLLHGETLPDGVQAFARTTVFFTRAKK